MNRIRQSFIEIKLSQQSVLSLFANTKTSLRTTTTVLVNKWQNFSLARVTHQNLFYITKISSTCNILCLNE